MSAIATLDAAGPPRSPATYPGYLAGRSPRNKGRRYPADPPRVEEIMAVMRQAGGRPSGLRLRGLIVVLWRAGLRISEALALAEGDLEPGRGDARPPRQGRQAPRGGDGRVGWQQLRPWLERRVGLPVGPLFCVLKGPTAGQPWSAPAVRTQFRRLAVRAGVRRRFAQHQLRHAHAVEMAREGVSLNVIQRQLGHANLGITSVYLEGIDSGEIIETVHGRRAPLIPAATALGR
jgi:site-specific recombinase XerD